MQTFSTQLQQALERVNNQHFTGYVSIVDNETETATYGTLLIEEGELVSAQYGNFTGRKAVEALKNALTPDVSVVSSAINASRQADLPSLRDLSRGVSVQRSSKRERSSSAPIKTASRQGFALRIFPKVLVVVFAVALLPMLGLGYNSYQAGQEAEAAVAANFASASSLIGTKVSDWVEMNARYLQHSATLPELTSMTKEGHVEMMNSLISSYEWMDSSVSVLPDGSNITTDAGATLDRNFSDRGWYQEITNGKPWGQDVLISLITEKPVFVMAVPILRNAQTVGMWAMGLNIQEVSSAVADTRVGNTGYAFLVDAQNRVIAHGEPGQLSEELQDFSQHPALLNTTDGQPFIFEDAQGVRKVAYTESLDELGFTLVVEQDYAEAYAPLISARRNAYLLLGLTLAMVVLSAYFFARRLVKPIESLTEATEAMSRGELGVTIEGTERGDEIGELARAVDRMGMSIKVLFKKMQAS